LLLYFNVYISVLKSLRTGLISLPLLFIVPVILSGQTRKDIPLSQITPASVEIGVWNTFVPEWGKNIRIPENNASGSSLEAFYFTGASYDDKVVNLPCKDFLIPVPEGKEIISEGTESVSAIEESNRIFNTSPISDFRASEWYPANPVISGPVVTYRKKQFQYIRVYPVQVRTDGTSFRKATSVKYKLSYREAPQNKIQQNARTYASNSVLSSGNWYKIGTSLQGIHRIDYSFIQALGIDPGSLNPQQIRLFGNGGGMLSQANSDYRNDDLVENAIQLVGMNDGTFDSQDYILFYGDNPHPFKGNGVNGNYYHELNFFTDSVFYFLNFNEANATQRVTVSPGLSGGTPLSNATQGLFYEQELSNFIKSGRMWFGESFDLTSSRSFNFPISNANQDSLIRVTVRVIARSSINTNFTVKLEGSTVGTVNLSSVLINNYEADYASLNTGTFYVPASMVTDGLLTVELIYNKNSASPVNIGWLDYIDVQFEKNLVIANAEQIFSFPRISGDNNTYSLNFSNADPTCVFWDISNPLRPVQVNGTLNGSDYTFSVTSDTLKSFIVFNNSLLKNPVYIGKIENQNLHGLSQADYLIITHPSLLNEAENLANLHRTVYGRTVHAVTCDKIYNEFSGGRMDISGIRDFIKMFYDRAGTDPSLMPDFVLMYGEGSYDPKSRITPNILTNLVPTYQSRNSLRPTLSYVSDDYFGFLDDNEGFWGESTFQYPNDNSIQTHMLDVGVGRIPVINASEAQAVTNKIRNYLTSTSAIGTWRNEVLLVADHKDSDGCLHVTQADNYSSQINLRSPCSNLSKVYMDSYVMTNTAEGSRFPDGKAALLQKLDEGSLLVNYTGHGGETGWSNSKILEISDIQKINNGEKLPVFITATCEFGRYDDPERRSGAELLAIKEFGGAIAMLTTVRLVYSGPNATLNSNFYNHVFTYDTINNRMPYLGEVFFRTKNASWLNGINNRNFTLMGDPGIMLAYPNLQATVKKINGIDLSLNDSVPLKALSLVTVEGEIQNRQGIKLDQYSGSLYSTVFDKPLDVNTIRCPFTYQVQKNRIFNGEASVNAGDFTFQFKVPLDISYEDGRGKISLYFIGNSTDGAGCSSKFIVGGTDTTVAPDKIGPEIELFLNDEKWADGGLVNQNPVLMANVSDESGINTIGTGIGHEITAKLNGNEGNATILNEFYSAKKDSYKDGTIRYNYTSLTPGEYDLELKVWDIANNSNTAKTRFIVADDAKLALEHVLNYPNPFTTNTRFFFEHNRNGEFIQAVIRIYTVSGKLVKTLTAQTLAEGNLFNTLDWDGLDDYGDKLGKGVYVYEVSVKVPSRGEHVSKFEKLVLLR